MGELKGEKQIVAGFMRAFACQHVEARGWRRACQCPAFEGQMEKERAIVGIINPTRQSVPRTPEPKRRETVADRSVIGLGSIARAHRRGRSKPTNHRSKTHKVTGSTF
jgi:hypothetical protein